MGWQPGAIGSAGGGRGGRAGPARPKMRANAAKIPEFWFSDNVALTFSRYGLNTAVSLRVLPLNSE